MTASPDKHPLEYFTRQDQLDSPLLGEVLDAVASADFDAVTPADVRAAIAARRRGVHDLVALLSPAARPLLEEIAQAARRETLAQFGTAVKLFTPLYIANYCANICTYCGFAAHHRIRRTRLSPEGLEQELAAIAATGLQEVLILTGESSAFSGVDYIAAAVARAAEVFPTVGVEIQPLNVDEYRVLADAGADFVSVYQETYDLDVYAQVHPGGRKRSYRYRFESPERALRAGMRGVNVGALFGLADWRRDALAAAVHAGVLHREFPEAELGFSVPRLRPTVADREVNARDVHEVELFQILAAYRLFLPFAGITVSTRERAGFRDHVLGVLATKVSAGVSTGVGEHADGVECGDEQFEISDERSVDEMRAAIAARGLQPVLNDHVRL